MRAQRIRLEAKIRLKRATRWATDERTPWLDTLVEQAKDLVTKRGYHLELFDEIHAVRVTAFDLFSEFHELDHREG